MTAATITYTDGVRAPQAAREFERRILTVAAVLTLAYFGAILAFSSTSSFYTLDDPYIHLALAENIARGHFGVNLEDYSNPSSSILWPWLMAAFQPFGLLLWAPLLVNIVCFLATISVLFGFTIRTLAADGRDATGALAIVGLGAFSFNLFGVIFTGMEHSLHTLVSVAAVTRLIEKRYDRIALAACIASPLVRFEGVLVLVFCLGAAIADRKYAFAAMTFTAVAVAIGVYEWMLASLGLPALPSSVLSKSDVSAEVIDGGHARLARLTASLFGSFHSDDGIMYAAFAAAFGWAAVTHRGRNRLIALGMLGVLAPIYLMRPIDGFARYNVFVFCIAMVACVHLLQKPLLRLIDHRISLIGFCASLLSINAALGLYVLLLSPLAARNIDRQQHQVHRFIESCWKKSIAVNDLGWTSYHNDHYVLDFAGLGNEAARKSKRDAVDSLWMKQLADAHDVEAAAIYPTWFKGDPPGWIRIGDLVMTDRRVTAAERTVAFYAARPEAAEKVRTCLQWLGRSLPNGALVMLQSP